MSITSSTDPETWVDRHGDALFSFAMTRLRDREVAEDVVQETLLAALKGRERFTGASSERTWLIGILKNKVIDRVRRSGRERPIGEIASSDKIADAIFEKGYWRASPGDWPRAGGAAEDREFREALDRCLSRLPDRLAAVFRLREVNGFETDEICNILEVSATNLATLLYRARARLRQCLDATWGKGES